MSKLTNQLEGRQASEFVFVEITGAQLEAARAASGGVIDFEAPQGSVLHSGGARVMTAFTGTTPTLLVGDAVTPNRYTGTAIALQTPGNTAFTPAAYVYGANGNTNKMRLTYAIAGGTPTGAGSLLLTLEFLKLNRADHTQGNRSAPSAAPNPGPH